MRRFVTLGIITLALCCNAIEAQDMRASQPFPISVQPGSKSYKVGDTITLEITITNTSQATIVLETGPGSRNVERHFDLRATGPDGRQIKERLYGLQVHGRFTPATRQGGVSHFGEEIEPGKQIHQQFDANKLYDFSLPGTYDLYLTRNYEGDPNVVVSSNHIAITVSQ